MMNVCICVCEGCMCVDKRVCACVVLCRYLIYVNLTDLLWRVGYVGAAYVSMIVVVICVVNGVR